MSTLSSATEWNLILIVTLDNIIDSLLCSKEVANLPSVRFKSLLLGSNQ